MTTVTYKGAHTAGVEVAGVWCEYGEPVELPDEDAAAIVAQNPDDWAPVKPAKTTPQPKTETKVSK